jgi:uncharacterized surface protein with fasciclin (FAS1) repeats
MNAIKTFTAGALAFALSVSAAKAADIVDTAVAAGSFNTLVTAVKAAGLVDTLRGPGPFTVFAPTDGRLQNFHLERCKTSSGPRTGSNSLLS